MKYSFMSFSTPDLSFADMLEMACRYGYDGMVPSLGGLHAGQRDVDHQTIKACVGDHHIAASTQDQHVVGTDGASVSDTGVTVIVEAPATPSDSAATLATPAKGQVIAQVLLDHVLEQLKELG